MNQINTIYGGNNIKTFQGLIRVLENYWENYGCIIMQPLDLEVGAGTSHPITFLRAIGPEPISVAYVQISRRPADGRYAQHPNRLQQYYQFQVVIKPSPRNMSTLYLDSLKSIGIDYMISDIRFVEDNWENPTLGAWGLGWEIWLNGIEVTQCTYFQQIGGLECNPITGEITYGLERLALFLQKVDDVYNLIWSSNAGICITYGDLFYENEVQQSMYNFEYTNVEVLFNMFNQYENEIEYLITISQPLPIPAYEKALKAIHVFNLLDARKVISITERKNYILRIRKLTKMIAEAYYISRKKLGFPMCVKS